MEFKPGGVGPRVYGVAGAEGLKAFYNPEYIARYPAADKALLDNIWTLDVGFFPFIRLTPWLETSVLPVAKQGARAGLPRLAAYGRSGSLDQKVQFHDPHYLDYCRKVPEGRLCTQHSLGA